MSLTHRDKPSQEFSSYIPGLAGIPLAEERRTKLIVHRQAAAGDANTVLRNVLLLLKETKVNGSSGLDHIAKFVSQVMGELELFLEFIEERHSTIRAEFQTKSMKDADTKRRKPMELAGIGFLQVIQIFAYLVYFRPVLLLVDEPDSHLHPATQERLVRVLALAAKEFGTQVILTTHSPSVVRALPPEARVVWMKDGKVQDNGDTAGRQLMGWGLLDKRILLLTEDSKTFLLRALLSQWPDLDRVVRGGSEI
jgi:predicted ATPase